MADSPQQLPLGVGTPYVNISDAAGNAIWCDGFPIGVYVTDFKYEYVEDGPDTGEFTLVARSTQLPNHGALKHNCKLNLQWGWLIPGQKAKRGPIRSVYIVAKQIDFTPQGVKMSIKFASKAIQLMNQPADPVDTTVDFVTWIINCINNDIVTDVRISHHKHASVLVGVPIEMGEALEIYNAQQQQQMAQLDEAKRQAEIEAQASMDTELDEAQSAIM